MIPNYLSNIKSSGIYRFVFDKSQLPAEAETRPMRIMMGYSEKGAFNTPVYVDDPAYFTKLFGGTNKKLERYGDFFHRFCLQALKSGPIYAMNIKNFEDETVQGINFTNTYPAEPSASDKYLVKDIYDTSRFWVPNPASLLRTTPSYFNIAAIDSKACSNTVFIKKVEPKGYDISFAEWFASVMNGEEVPAYLDAYRDKKLKDYFLKVYVFRGKIDSTLLGTGGAPTFYDKYFEAVGGDSTQVKPKASVKNAFGEDVDALDAFAENSRSNLVNTYTGIIFPDFINANQQSISLVDLFNADGDDSKMMMYCDIDGMYECVEDTTGAYSDYKTLLENGTSETNFRTPKSVYIEGYTYANAKPASSSDEAKEAWQNQILDALKGITVTDSNDTEREIGYKGLRIALTDRLTINFKYMVDCFDSYISLGSKAVMSNICKIRQNADAILNFPSAERFKKYKITSGDDEGETPFVKNAMIDFSVLEGTTPYYTLADEENGAVNAWYFTQLKFNNPITQSKYVVPSAALVSNAFMAKYDGRFAFSIVSGPNYGKITAENLVGPDYYYSREDRDILEPFGVNCLVYVPTKGTYINSNQTAKQNPVTGLSKIHIQELVVFLQDEIDKLLESYHWELNTPELRSKIKDKADVILETCKNNGGIYDYETQCDEKNNTPEVIDNEMLILDYGVEPARGAGKMIQRLTLYRTGGLKAKNE